MIKKTSNKKGVSPVVATVLLVGMVIVIGLIVFLLFRGMVTEERTKFGKNIKLVCDDVQFNADYDSGTLRVVNLGNVPIFNLKVKMINEAGGSYTTKNLNELSVGEKKWPDTGLNKGGTFEGVIDAGGADKIILIPVLIGSSESGKGTHTCDEKQYGYNVPFS